MTTELSAEGSLLVQPVSVVVETGGTPLWLTLVTLSFSLAAIGVSLYQARLNSRMFLLSRPNVELEIVYASALRTADWDELGRGVMISLLNKSKEAADLVSVWVVGDGFLLSASQLTSGDRVTFPLRLAGFTKTELIADMRKVEKDLPEVAVLAEFGHGVTVKKVVRVDDLSSLLKQQRRGVARLLFNRIRGKR